MQETQIQTAKLFERNPVVRRGAVGKTDRQLDIYANYIRLDVADDAGIFEYYVSFSPAVDNLHERYRLINAHRDVIGETRMFDGMKLLRVRQGQVDP